MQLEVLLPLHFHSLSVTRATSFHVVETGNQVVLFPALHTKNTIVQQA